MIGYVKRGVIYDRALPARPPPPEAAAKKRGEGGGKGEKATARRMRRGNLFSLFPTPWETVNRFSATDLRCP